MKQGRLAAKEMRGAGDVDEEAIRRIERNKRTVAAQRPGREALERRSIGGGVGRLDPKARHAHLRLGKSKTWCKAKPKRGLIRGGDDLAATLPGGKNERPLRRRRGGSQLSAEP